MRYKPWGEVRYSWTAGQSTTPGYKLSSYTFTGQFSYMDDPTTSGVTEGFGLMFYNARFYDPALGRFTSADTIIPGGVQGYDRYAYVNNNPIRYNDPTGHMCSDPEDPTPECDGANKVGEKSHGGGLGNGGEEKGGNNRKGKSKDENKQPRPDACEISGEGCESTDPGLISPPNGDGPSLCESVAPGDPSCTESNYSSQQLTDMLTDINTFATWEQWIGGGLALAGTAALLFVALPEILVVAAVVAVVAGTIAWIDGGVNANVVSNISLNTSGAGDTQIALDNGALGGLSRNMSVRDSTGMKSMNTFSIPALSGINAFLTTTMP